MYMVLISHSQRKHEIGISFILSFIHRTVVELSRFIDSYGRNGFSVFCGDLNAEPDSRAIQYLIVFVV